MKLIIKTLDILVHDWIGSLELGKEEKHLENMGFQGMCHQDNCKDMSLFVSLKIILHFYS